MSSGVLPRVLVLLATRNGGAWVGEQVESIIAQRGVLVTLVVSDDGSSDGTVAAVKSAVAGRVPMKWLPTQLPSGSAARNFLRLMQAATVSEHHFVALADQDDIWQVDKLQRAVEALQASDASGYSAAVCGVWPDGRRTVLKQSGAIRAADFLFEGAGQGCSFVVRTELMSAFQTVLQEHLELMQQVHYHDWLLYLFCRVQGLSWHFDARPCLDYRQHNSNDTGARSSWSGINRRMALIRSGWYGEQIRHMAGLATVLVSPPDPRAVDYLALLDKSAARRSARCQLIAFVLRNGRRKLSDRLVLAVAALLGYLEAR